MSISGYGNNGKPPAPTSYANSQAAERQQIFLLDEYSNEKRHKAAVAAAAATRNQLTSNGGGGGVALVDDPTHDMSFNNDYQSEPYEYTPNGVSMLPSLDHRNKYLKAHAGHPPPPP